METKKVTLKFYSLEYEWEGLKEDGENELWSGLYCDCVDEISIFVDGEELTDQEALDHLDSTMHKCPTKRIDFGEDVVGVQKWENKSCYMCEINVQGEFDPTKLTLNIGWYEFGVGDETISTDEVLLFSVTYDDTEYELEFEESRGWGSELIWGYDPEDEDEDEDEEFEDWDEENEDEDEDLCESEEESVEARLRREYDEVYKGDGIYFIDKDGKCGIADDGGNVIIPIRYDWTHDEMDMDDGVILAGIGDKTYYVCSGGFEIDVTEYDMWGHFKYGRTKIGVFNGKYGMIDKTGKIVVPIIYDEIYKWFEDGTIKVKLDGEEFLIDAEGNRIEE